jgi:hypothetical protein
MSKYDALGRFLRNQNTNYVPMTFREIERVTGTKLPSSKQYPAWWSNNAWNNVMTKVWLDAGFRSEQVDIAGEKLVFRREVHLSKKEQEVPSPSALKGKGMRHPIIGALKGTFTVEPGWDPAKSPFEEFGELDAAVERTADLIDEGLQRRSQ